MVKKDIKFAKHAEIQLKERGIEKERIKEIISNPSSQIIETEKSGKIKIAQKQIFEEMRGKNYLIRVFFKETEREIVIITAYKTSKIKKYWREE